MRSILLLKKGEVRNLSMSIMRKTKEPIKFSQGAVYQIREYPYLEENRVFPSATKWASASTTGNKVVQSVDTNAAWAVPGKVYRIYFRVFVTDPAETASGAILFGLVD